MRMIPAGKGGPAPPEVFMRSLNWIPAVIIFFAAGASAGVLDGFEKVARYDAAEAVREKSAWQAKNYAAGRITVKDGRVLIDNGENGRDGYGLVTLLSPDLYQLDNAKIALRAKLEIVRANGTDNTLALSVACGNGAGGIRDATVMLAPGKVVIGGVGTTRTDAIRQGKPFECIVLFDPMKCDVSVFVDGKKTAGAVKDLPAKEEAVWFGDGSGTVSGAVEIEFVEVYRLEK